MEIFALISAFVSLASLLVTSSNQRAQMQQNETQFQEQKAIANQQIENEKEIADMNFGLSKEQFEYQKQLNELQMQREDTAMQRQVADLRNAGLSPLMVSGGSSTGSYLSANAPQYNSSGIMQAMSNLLGVHQDYASRKQMAYQFERQQQLQTAQSVSDLISARLSNKYLAEQIRAQQIANEYNVIHGIRDPNAMQAVVDYVMKHIDAKGGVNPTLRDLGDDISEVRDNLIKGATDTLKNNAEKAIEKTKEVYEGAKGVVSGAVNYVSDKIPDKPKSYLKRGRDYVSRKWSQFYNWTKSKFN